MPTSVMSLPEFDDVNAGVGRCLCRSSLMFLPEFHLLTA